MPRRSLDLSFHGRAYQRGARPEVGKSHADRIVIPKAGTKKKTGTRTVPLHPKLREEIGAWRATPRRSAALSLCDDNKKRSRLTCLNDEHVRV